MEGLILEILRDYFYWRKNYFPGDPIQISQLETRDFLQQHDALDQSVHELLAHLKRNFPFYSPRYLAHQLSDTLIPSTLGYFAGMLYNPNNITPEAAPVTTELEIDACSAILEMLGYTPPPPLPSEYEDVTQYYKRHSQREFGWCHITSGGTVANIEALWVARQVRYFPLAVREIAMKYDLLINVQLPNARVGIELKNMKGELTDIRQIDPYQLLLIKPNESIYLLPKFITAMRFSERFRDIPDDKLGAHAWKLLGESKYSLLHGTATPFAEFPPVILICGTRHYSVAKAADLLGIGQANVIPIKADAAFRMSITDLEHRLTQALRSRQVPLTVIAAAGTTEEGAVDPINDIVDVRTRFEREHNCSFWLHVDAAWGGFMRSLFCIDPRDRADAIMMKLDKQLGLGYTGEFRQWHQQLSKLVMSLLKGVDVRGNPTMSSAPGSSTTPQPDGEGLSEAETPTNRPTEGEENIYFSSRVERELNRMERLLDDGKIEDYIAAVGRLPGRFKGAHVDSRLHAEWRLNLMDIVDWVQDYTKEVVELGFKQRAWRLRLTWPDKRTGYAYMAFSLAESITVDPHKMGYSHYPLGTVAFRNDLVRLFVLQKAPYITSSTQNPMLHVPPLHVAIDTESNSRKTVIESFSPFILEGSRPGAAAASLWLSTKSIPLTARGHGRIVRESLIAARIVYEWLARWDDLMRAREEPVEYQFIPVTREAPDTNIVVFVVKKKTSNSLAQMNMLSKRVYSTFSIQSELGDREYSYSQTFFLSNTMFDQSQYPLESLEHLFSKCNLSSRARTEYMDTGLVVLRATVMSPYINHARKGCGQAQSHDYPRIFVEELARAAAESVVDL